MYIIVSLDREEGKKNKGQLAKNWLNNITNVWWHVFYPNK